jgi:hypothetical protein
LPLVILGTLGRIVSSFSSRIQVVTSFVVQLLDDLDDLQALAGRHDRDLLPLERRAQERVAAPLADDRHAHVSDYLLHDSLLRL